MVKNSKKNLGKKVLSIVSATAMTLTSFSVASADSLKDANVIIENTQYDSGYHYISTYQKSAYNGKKAFKLAYEYVEKDSDGKYQDRDTNQLETIDYSDTFEFIVFDTSWGGWNPTKVGQTDPKVGTTYTTTVPISDIEGALKTGNAVQGINFETGRIGDTKVKVKSLELVNADGMVSDGAEFTGSWVKQTGGTLTKKSGTGTLSADQWKIDITGICVYDFKNPTIDVTVDYGKTAPGDYKQAEILNGVTGKPVVENYPKVTRTGEVTYTTEFNKNLTSLSVCYDACTVKAIKIYDNTAGDVETSVTGKTAAQTAELMGSAWNLGNAFEGTDKDGKVSEVAYGNPVTTKKLIQAVKDQGFNTVRVPVSYIDKIQADNTVDDDYLARIKQVVDYAYDMGMYVVIDMHNDGGNGVTTKWLDITKSGDEFEAIKTKFAAVWKDIATCFKGYDQRLVFEGFNELMNGNYSSNPTETQLSNIDALNQAFVDAVRSAGDKNTDRVLIVAGYNTNIDQTIAHFVKPTDKAGATNRLMLSCHYYDPYDFALNENSSVKTWGTEKDLTDMYTSISNIADFASKKGMPVFIGEYGPIDKGNLEARADYCYYLNYYAGLFGDMATAYWDNGFAETNGSALFDRTDNKALSAYSTIISKIKQGKADGKAARG